MVLVQGNGLTGELEGLDFGDARLNRRAAWLLAGLARCPGDSFPDVWKDDSSLEAAYRFFGNESVDPNKLVEAHGKATARRVSQAKGPVVVAHDTTEFSIPMYFQDKRRQHLGKKGARSQGFDAHVSFAFELGKVIQPLGTLAMQPFVGKDEIVDTESAGFWAKRGGQFDNETKRWTEGVLRAEERLADSKQSVIHVADCEFAKYAVLVWMLCCEFEFVTRALINQLRVGPERLTLPEAMANLPWQGQMGVSIAAHAAGRGSKQQKAHPSRKTRTAMLSYRSATIDLIAPARSNETYNPLGAQLPAELTVNVIEILELHPPAGEQPVQWVLVTSLPVGTDDEINFVIECYRARWGIEEFFRALKQGCRYEHRQLESAAALLVALALLLPVAWQLLCVHASVQTAPQVQWRKLYSPAILKVVRKLAPKRKLTAAATVRDVYLAIAYLGGHLKRNGEPGWQTVLRGYADVVAGLKVLGERMFFLATINA